MRVSNFVRIGVLELSQADYSAHHSYIKDRVTHESGNPMRIPQVESITRPES
jgi:hypothetical protein